MRLLIVSLLLVMSMPARSQEEWVLVWFDEFSVPGLPDPAKWSYDEGGGGWGNNELQYYTANREENARVERGKLIIEARKESMGNRNYTSARLVTRGHAAWLYGKVVVRAKLPTGAGTWPAIWMLPESSLYGGWPRSGEIDIMEHVGFEPDFIYGTVHTAAYNHIQKTQRGDTLPVLDAEEAYHEYALIWKETEMVFLIDGVEFFRFANEGTGPEAWPFDQPFHLILNLAVGGNWGGKRGVDDSIWPQHMEVDYVRIYQSPKP